MRALSGRTDPQPRVEDYPRVSLLALAHCVNDLSGNMMTSLTPFLVLRGAISTTMAGLVVLVYLIGSSVLQPVFGLLSDRSGRRVFVVLGPLCLALAASAFGWGTNAALLLTIAAIGGIGTAAFHPQAASMVDQVSVRTKGWFMSIFSMGGNIGFSLGPLAAAGIAFVGLHWTPLILLPGLLVTALLARFAPYPQTQQRPRSLEHASASSVRRRIALSLIIGVIAVRSGVQYGLIILLPLYAHSRGQPTELGSLYAFVLSFSGAIGGLAGGYLSDRYGRRVVVVVSLLLAAPLIFGSLVVQSVLVWPLVALAGISLVASNSVTVVQGQELLPHNTGIASGLTMGLGFGLSGIITSALTALADRSGVHAAIFTTPALAILAAALGLCVPAVAARRPSLSRA